MVNALDMHCSIKNLLLEIQPKKTNFQLAIYNKAIAFACSSLMSATNLDSRHVVVFSCHLFRSLSCPLVHRIFL